MCFSLFAFFLFSFLSVESPVQFCVFESLINFLLMISTSCCLSVTVFFYLCLSVSSLFMSVSGRHEFVGMITRTKRRVISILAREEKSLSFYASGSVRG